MKLQTGNFLDYVGDEVAKRGRRLSKQRQHKQLWWVYCATNTVLALFIGSQNKQVILDCYLREICLLDSNLVLFLCFYGPLFYLSP